jgi:hypothetical protein
MAKFTGEKLDNFTSTERPDIEEDKPVRKTSGKGDKMLVDDDTEDLEEDEVEDDAEDDSEEDETGDDLDDEKDTADDEEEFDEIVYNKERVKIPVKDRQTYLQKGYNYDKVKGKADAYEAKLLKLQEATGKDIDDVIDIVNEKQINDAIDDLLEENPNLTEDQAKKLVLKNKQADDEKRRAQRIIQETQAVKDKEELKNKRFFKELESEIDSLVKTTPGLTVKTAYNYLLGERFEELLAKEKETTKKRTVADMADRAMRQVETKKDGKDSAPTVSKFQARLAREMGVPVSEVAKRVKR